MVILLIFASCKKLEDLNINTKDPHQVSGESLFTNAQASLFHHMVNSDVNFNIWRLIMQQWTETTYIDESNYDLTTRTIPDNHWDFLYQQVLKNLDEASKVIEATSYPEDPSPDVKKNKLAVVEILTVYTYSILVETFGNIPYTKALDINNLLPAYDDGKTVYEDLINRLTTAVGNINTAYGSMDAADNMYQGNTTQWARFANSLKLRMALVLADVDPAFSQTAAEGAVSNAIGVMSSNADNAQLVFLATQPNANPIYEDQVASGRQDFVPTGTIIDTMNKMNDPRRQFYFTLVDTSSSGTPKLAFVGGIPGASNDYTKYSHVGEKIYTATFPGLIFDYAETELYLAEAVERGYNVGGTAADHYTAGVTASLTYWGVADTLVTAYLAQPGVAYSTAPGDYKQKIGFQLYLALYNRGFEAWTQWRLLDFPVITAPPTAFSAIPIRYTYPIEEQTLNGANYEAASAAIGGDLVTTKLFWDKF